MAGRGGRYHPVARPMPALPRLSLPAVLAAALALASASCVAVGSGSLAAPVRAAEDRVDPVAYYDLEAERVWAHAKETLAHLSERQLRLDDVSMVAVATGVSDGVVEVRVESLGPGRSRMSVSGRLYSFPSDALAAQVLDQIDRQIEPRTLDL